MQTATIIPISERRRHRRFDPHGNQEGILVRRKPDGSASTVCWLRIENISAGGLRGLATAPLSRHQQLELYFPNRGPMAGQHPSGRIVYCLPTEDGYEVGLAFTHPVVRSNSA